jgi:hypothetical protein
MSENFMPIAEGQKDDVMSMLSLSEEKYGRKPSRIVIRYGQYGRKVS